MKEGHTEYPSKGHRRVPSESASVHMDAIRGLAALLVLISHWRNLLFQDFVNLTHTNPVLKAAYFVTSLGHPAVMIFFVLSGYLVGGSALRQIKGCRWSWKAYLFARGTRLYTVLIPALLLGWMWDAAGLHLFGTDGIYGGKGGQIVLRFPTSSRLSPNILIGNYLFVQNILVPPFGSNGPLWSLTNEFWYYIAFPFLALALQSRVSILGRIASASVVALIFVFTGISISLYFTIWLIGILVGALPAPARLNHAGRLMIVAGSLVAVLAALIISKRYPGVSVDFLGTQFLADFVLGCAVAILLYVTLHWAHKPLPHVYIRLSRAVAKSSYTLYLVHLPLLVFITAAIIHERWEPSLMHLLTGLFILVIIYSYAQAVYFCFEARTDFLRKAILRMFGQPREPVCAVRSS